jgi:replication-associated recombination protein RarA
MLSGGDHPSYIMRRLVRFASEDIGLADPNALLKTIAAWDVFERIGRPEGEIAIVQSVFILLQHQNLMRYTVLKTPVFVWLRKPVQFRHQNIY